MNTPALILAMCLSLGSVAPSAHAGFSDPLDTPAVPSALSSEGLFNGLALAGRRVVAVGQRGHILYSDDGGNTWTQAAVPVQSDLTSVSFPDAQHGWAVGHDGVVLASSDAGATWVKQLDGRQIGPLMVKYYQSHPPAGMAADELERLQADAERFATDGPDKPLLDVWFKDDLHGYVVGAFNLVLQTEDGGKSWIPWFDRTENPRMYHLYAIKAVGADVYIAGEQGLLMKLDAQAQRFRAIPLPYKGTLFGLAGDEHAVMTYGLRGTVLRSTDDGKSWAQVNTGTRVSLTTSARDADGDLILMGQNGQVLDSKDDGATFIDIPLEQRNATGAMILLDGRHAVLAGPHGLHRVTLNFAARSQP